MQVVCLGEAIIDFMPSKAGQSLKDAPLLRKVAGGATANVTVALARLGVKAAFLGKLGDDPFGHFLKETLQANKVDVSHVLLTREANTGMSFAWAEAAANNEARYLFVRLEAADRKLRPSEIDPDWLKQAKILQFGSLPLAGEESKAALFTALHYATTNNLLTCYDVNMRLPAWPSPEIARADMLSLLTECDIVKLNRHELRFLTGESELLAGISQIRQARHKLLIVTLDRDGCYYQSQTQAGFVPGFAVKVVDTVGAGDAFMGAMLAGLLANQPDLEDKAWLEELCRFANAAGALTVTKAGAIPALPTRPQINRFLKSLALTS